MSRYALIFINWNSGELTVSAARSALAATSEPGDLRFIVVDNGSADDSVALIRRELPGADVIEMGRNRGFAGAVNAGLREVKEPFAFVLNTDIEFLNDGPLILASALEADSDAVLACPKLLRPDGSEQAAAVPEPKLCWELFNRSLARRFIKLDKKKTSVVPGVVGPCMAVHMARLADIGFLDERFFFFFEETDWCKRITDAGRHVLFVPEAEVMHLQGETANRRPFKARVQFYRGRYQFFHKHYGFLLTALLFSGLWIRLSLDLLLYALLAALTLGREKYRDKLAVASFLWLWHLLLARPKWGFE